ncbi:MAG: host-nuclease inhibitor Gam family protein [Firmicutes bacterium]|nr:host-nuclease inhibitor Gam family protein [Bacillota bacterium]
MARVRIESAKLKSWEDVSLNLKEIGECQLAIEGIEAALNEKISDLKLEAAVQAKPYQDSIKKLELEIKEFTEENKVDIKGKTKFMDFGKVGFRQSTKIIIKSIQAVLNGLKARRMDDCITVTETVNKERLREYPDEVIAAVGASKKTEDVFWYEVDKEKLVNV